MGLKLSKNWLINWRLTLVYQYFAKRFFLNPRHAVHHFIFNKIVDVKADLWESVLKPTSMSELRPTFGSEVRQTPL